MTESDYIQLDNPVKRDRTIRTIYTPKEIVKIIQYHFNSEMKFNKLTRSEKVLLWDSYNRLIMEFKDD